MSGVEAPGKVMGLKVKNSKGKKIAAKWNAVSDADGYQITYSTNSKFKKSKKKTVLNTSVILKKLKKKKTYYVKLRAYKNAGTGKKFGKYSAVKRIKIKK